MATIHATLSAAVEGLVDEAVAHRLAEEAGLTIATTYGKAGKPALLKRLPAYNRAAQWSPWLVLVDLDLDADCAPPVLPTWLPRPAALMCLRVAVRAVEAWLLADREAIARFLGVPVSRVPTQPEALTDPKRSLVDLARRSRRRDIREDMVPRPTSGRAVGPAYASRLIQFAQTDWRPEVAARACDSLRRCQQSLSQLTTAR